MQSSVRVPKWLVVLVLLVVFQMPLFISPSLARPSVQVSAPAALSYLPVMMNYPAVQVSPPVDPAAPWTPKLIALVNALTLDEKISLVHAGLDPTPRGQAGYTPDVPRLGIPPRRDADALGINVWQDATAWPTRLGIAASFDRSAALKLGQGEGAEGRALGVDMLYGPQVDLDRTPNWWRNMTTFGEDPYLAAQLAVQEVTGIQSQGLMDEPKHIAIYNGAYYSIPSIVDDQTVHELYLVPFEAVARDGLPAAFMCSYAIFQITPSEDSPAYACENSLLLNDILRGQWGFKGFVLSDFGATHSVSILQGLDTSFPYLTFNLFDAPVRARVDPTSPLYDLAYAAALDQSVARILYQMERFGLLDCASPKGLLANCSLSPRPALNKSASAAKSERLAEEAAVLLKNENGALPLTEDDLHLGVAVIGPTANLLPSSPGGERSRGFSDRNSISPLVALQNLAPDANITFSPGVDRIGTLVPASAFPGGLTRTQSDSNGTYTDTQVDFTASNPLNPGVFYTWTGTLDVPTDDTYALWLQTSFGQVTANGSIDTIGFPAPPLPSLAIDGVSKSISSPFTILPNTYPGGNTVNGQYLGWTNAGAYVPLTAGAHTIRISYDVPSNAVTPVLFRLTWSPVQATIDAAVTAASQAHLAILFVDDANASGGILPLGPYQDRLVQAVAAANPNTIVVLNTGNPVLMPWLGSVKAVLEMWYPGQEGGTATARLLLGSANPGGRLPITFPASPNDTPFAGHPERLQGVDGQIVWSEGLFIGYRWYDQQDKQPLFEFGYGLSYTTFDYASLNITTTSDGGFDVSFRVQNVGTVIGDEVPQVYIGPSPDAPATVQQAVKKLVQFERITLLPGYWRELSLHVTQRDLSYWSTNDQDWVVGTGSRAVFVGSSSRDIRLIGSVEVR
jgi:beta-glucosidase